VPTHAVAWRASCGPAGCPPGPHRRTTRLERIVGRAPRADQPDLTGHTSDGFVVVWCGLHNRDALRVTRVHLQAARRTPDGEAAAIAPRRDHPLLVGAAAERLQG